MGKINFKLSAAIVIFTLSCYCSILMAQHIKSPAEFFDHAMGADYKLVPYDELVGYYDYLMKHSERIRVREVGKTTEGRPMLLLEISDPETLNNIEKHQQVQQKIADPRLIVSPEEKNRLIEESKVVVWINCQLHSTECASSQMAPELAYELATLDSKEVMEILNRVIIILIPCANPMGSRKSPNGTTEHWGMSGKGKVCPGFTTLMPAMITTVTGIC